MRTGVISIWFFVGVSLLFNGLLIFCAGISEFVHPPEKPVVLFQVHANVWWGAVLLLVGILYCVVYAPGRNRVSATS